MEETTFILYEGLELHSQETYTPTDIDIIEFGMKWDPYPFHTDSEAAKNTFFGELIAPGVMTDSILIKLAHKLSPQFPDDAVLGMIGAESVRYIKPVKPGQELSSHGVVVSLEQSKSNRGQAIMKVEWEIKTSEIVVLYNRTNVLLVSSKYCCFTDNPK